MSREVGDERARYTRRSLRDRAIEVIDWVRGHPAAAAVIALFLGVVAIQLVAPARSALPADLRVGDCLYIRTPQSMDVGPGARPIGDPDTVAGVLLAGGAEQAPCSSSHGHEVSGLVPGDVPGVSQGLTTEVLASEARAGCDGVFPAYVGHREFGSSYVTFAVVPTQAQIDAGLTNGICLIARQDGQWMTHPARGSGE